MAGSSRLKALIGFELLWQLYAIIIMHIGRESLGLLPPAATAAIPVPVVATDHGPRATLVIGPGLLLRDRRLGRFFSAIQDLDFYPDRSFRTCSYVRTT